MTPHFTIIAACALTALWQLPAHADGIYKYVESDGTIVYTNVRPTGVRAKKLKGTFHRSQGPTDPPALRPSSWGSYDEHVKTAAKRYRIPVALVRAIMHAESNFDSHAVSSRGASGLMQLMPDTAQAMYVKDIFDVRDNIEGGCRHLRMLLDRYGGNLPLSIAAYNAGTRRVEDAGGVPPIPETREYLSRVLRYRLAYLREGARVLARR